VFEATFSLSDTTPRVHFPLRPSSKHACISGPFCLNDQAIIHIDSAGQFNEYFPTFLPWSTVKNPFSFAFHQANGYFPAFFAMLSRHFSQEK